MALDTKGIWLSEVKGKYPEQFQYLKYDVALDYDSMYKPKVLSSFESGIDMILTLLFMKPGQYPSIPELGIDIESYLFEYSDDNKIPSEIKSKLDDQCSMLSMVGFDIDVSLQNMPDGTGALIVTVSASETLGYGSESPKVIIGITYDKLNRLYVRRKYIH